MEKAASLRLGTGPKQEDLGKKDAGLDARNRRSGVVGDCDGLLKRSDGASLVSAEVEERGGFVDELLCLHSGTRPNVWRQRRAKRVRCTPGLGATE